MKRLMLIVAITFAGLLASYAQEASPEDYKILSGKLNTPTEEAFKSLLQVGLQHGFELKEYCKELNYMQILKEIGAEMPELDKGKRMHKKLTWTFHIIGDTLTAQCKVVYTSNGELYTVFYDNSDNYQPFAPIKEQLNKLCPQGVKSKVIPLWQSKYSINYK